MDIFFARGNLTFLFSTSAEFEQIGHSPRDNVKLLLEMDGLGLSIEHVIRFNPPIKTEQSGAVVDRAFVPKLLANKIKGNLTRDFSCAVMVYNYENRLFPTVVEMELAPTR